MAGNSPVHRAPLWLKFLGVLLVSLSTFLVTTWQGGLVVVALVLLVHTAAGIGAARLITSLRPFVLLLVVLGAFQWWSRSGEDAARVVLGLLAAYIAAGILTATTPIEEILDGVVTAARPLRRVVPPETVGLTVAIMIRSIPWVAGSLGTVRDAARARGLERSPRAVVLPVVIHTVAYARRTGDALAARGLGDPDDEG